ncbi:hypothetical protein D3C73_1503020 [compost metagenome]
MAALAGEQVQQIDVVRCLALLLGNPRAQGLAADTGLAELHQQTLDKGLIRGEGKAGVGAGKTLVFKQRPIVKEVLECAGKP